MSTKTTNLFQYFLIILFIIIITIAISVLIFIGQTEESIGNHGYLLQPLIFKYNDNDNKHLTKLSLQLPFKPKNWSLDFIWDLP